MPELPEVETIRSQLEVGLLGAVVVGVEVRRENCYFGSKNIDKEVVKKVERVGKYLYVHFQSGRGLVIHLKMTGRLVLDVPIYNELPHTRVVLSLGDGRKVYYWDSRTFGYISYLPQIEIENEMRKQKLGPDPWEMKQDMFYQLTQKYARPIKNLILDQTLLAGVGNIYANDALWEAKIMPNRAAKSLTEKQSAKLLTALRQVMQRGLETGGASDNSYVNALGEKGRYQEEFRVYKRSGLPCYRCGNKLTRIVVGGRGSWVCNVCQK